MISIYQSQEQKNANNIAKLRIKFDHIFKVKEHYSHNLGTVLQKKLFLLTLNDSILQHSKKNSYIKTISDERQFIIVKVYHYTYIINLQYIFNITFIKQA